MVVAGLLLAGAPASALDVDVDVPVPGSTDTEKRKLARASAAQEPSALEPGLVSASAGQEVDADGSSADVEASLDDMQRQIDELRAKLGEAVVVGGSEESMKFFGRIHFDAWAFPGTSPGINVFENGDPSIAPRDSLEVRRARIGVSGDLQDNMLYKVEIDFGKPNKFAFKDVYFGFKDVPVVQRLLIGNQKRPYGLDHLNSSRFNVFMERPFVIEAVNQDSRRVGVAAYSLSADKSWNWRYGLYAMNDWAATGTVKSSTLQPEVTGRLARTVWYEDDGRNYGHAAVSGSWAWPDGDPSNGDTANQANFKTRPEARSQSKWLETGPISGAQNVALLGLEGVANYGRAQLTGELMNSWVMRDQSGPDVYFFGAYLYSAYFLTGEYMPWDRKSGTLARIEPGSDLGGGGWGAWQLAARLSYADFSDQDILGGVGKSLTLGLNWYWNSHSRLQLNYIRGQIDDRSVDAMGTTFTDGPVEKTLAAADAIFAEL